MELNHILAPLRVYDVDCFVLISGYFGIKLKLRKILYFLVLCIFWGSFAILISSFVNDDYLQLMHPRTIVDGLFPISSGSWLFFSNYFCLMLFAPLLNNVEKMPKHHFMAIIILLMWCFSGVAWGRSRFDYLGTMMLLYLIGRFLRLYPIEMLRKYRFLIYGIGLAGMYFTLWLKPYPYNNPFVILTAIAFFVIFVNIHIGHSKTINYIAKCVFVVFLVTDHGYTRMLFDEYVANTFSIWLLPIIAIMVTVIGSSVAHIVDTAIIDKAAFHCELTVEKLRKKFHLY